MPACCRAALGVPACCRAALGAPACCRAALGVPACYRVAAVLPWALQRAAMLLWACQRAPVLLLCCPGHASVLSPNTSQKKLNPRHVKWVQFLQEYSFVLKHEDGVENKPVDALSRRVALLQSMRAEVIGFDRSIEGYPTCLDFGDLYVSLRDGQSIDSRGFVIFDEFLFKGDRLCVPRTSLHDFLV
ncbi:uncharacterized protein LOC131224293 [Magnolia sinica]|uniref:uncharacterized protein LOC131224293 n=1 Tax=Magnolia sinica TaxID=86752 RepID=UPI002659F030|nr:uncharacterized protein LOC131224293 [Magnolia sinica]